ncbi:hypothetical protein ACQ5RZ_09005 [Lactobacillus delbrueckii subsp. bulgaricus]|jgi:hypothetical protein|uniref:hypothetical protein n=1 Tax=Lactobacillus delbrueckii TaxID=1584 RepID=UPI001F48769A|nr:hypothetical protein [Lactobacillus delbrueckii]GHN50272.1 hypothetical protein ME800_18810 [Lactobacillus delbrueckii]
MAYKLATDNAQRQKDFLQKNPLNSKKIPVRAIVLAITYRNSLMRICGTKDRGSLAAF